MESGFAARSASLSFLRAASQTKRISYSIKIIFICATAAFSSCLPRLPLRLVPMFRMQQVYSQLQSFMAVTACLETRLMIWFSSYFCRFFRHCGITRVSQLLAVAVESQITRTHRNETRSRRHKEEEGEWGEPTTQRTTLNSRNEIIKIQI